MWIDQEQRQNLAMARLGPILQRKRTYAVLKRIGEADYSTLLGNHAAEFLRCQAGIVVIPLGGIAIYLLHELVLVLVVAKVYHIIIHPTMAESERAVSDIMAIVVVDC